MATAGLVTAATGASTAVSWLSRLGRPNIDMDTAAVAKAGWLIETGGIAGAERIGLGWLAIAAAGTGWLGIELATGAGVDGAATGAEFAAGTGLTVAMPVLPAIKLPK